MTAERNAMNTGTRTAGCLLQPNRLQPDRHGGDALRSVIGWTILLAATATCVVKAPARSEAADAGRQVQQFESPLAIEVSPVTFEFSSPRDKLTLVVTGRYADGIVRDVTHEAQFATSDAEVVTVSDNVVRPAGDGAATIVARVGKVTSATRIKSTSQEETRPISFRYETLAALSKQGCNAGACHGSPSGKGGFRLSLRGFDAKSDEVTLIREAQGRRTNLVDPDASLLLLKPLMKVPHGGGKKIRSADPAYAVLRDWIREGCQTDPEDAPRCIGIELLPPGGRLLKHPANTQQLSVLAAFSDGSRRDVTDLAVFSSSDSSVATVDRDGFVNGLDRGEAAIIVRYMEFIESTSLTFVRDIKDYRWNDPPENNYVDTHVYSKLRQLQFLPARACTDGEFVRRVHLDVIGIVPPADVVVRFLADESPDKRAELIESLLERPEYAKFWALKWGDLLRMTSGQVGSSGVHKYHRWVNRAIDSNMAYDDFARELLTASGSTFDNPPANFYRTASDMNECVETISQLFLGARLQCAKCHNHPFERWTQDNYFGMGAFFNRVERKKTRRSDELFVWSATSGEVTQPRTGQEMQPWAPGIGAVAVTDSTDRRLKFADWLTDPANPFFAKVEVNRIWSHLLGRGIVDPTDDFRDSNPPSNAKLLDALAADFVEHEYDRKHVIRTILNSNTYQSSIQANEFNRDDTKYFSHYLPRLLTAEQLLDAICHVTGVPEVFGSLPPGTKATQLPAPDLLKHDFLRVFGQPARQTVCQCERTADSNLGMAIEFLNGPLIHGKLRAEENRFQSMIAEGSTDEEVITSLHLASIARFPTDQELRASRAHLLEKQELQVLENSRFDRQIEELQSSIDKLLEKSRATLLSAKLEAIPQSIRGDTQTAIAIPAADRTAVQKYLVERLGEMLQINEEEVLAALPEETAHEIAAWRTQASELAAQKKTRKQCRVMAMEDICWVLLNRNEFLFNH